MKFHKLPMGANCFYEDDVVKVDHSRYGRGLFSKVQLERDFAIGPYSGQRLSDKEASLEQQLGNVYLFEVMKDIVIDGRDKRFSTAVRYANSADIKKEQNCDFKVLETGEVWLVTVAAVKPGDELLPYYDMTDNNLSQVTPVDTKWLSSRIWAKDSFNALVACEKHRRHLEEQLSDMEDRLLLEQQAIIKYSFQQKVKTPQQTKIDHSSSEDAGDDDYKPTVKKTKSNEHDTLPTKTESENMQNKACYKQMPNPRFGIKETDRGWTGYHEFVARNFRSIAHNFNVEMKAGLRKKAEEYRDTGTVTNTILRVDLPKNQVMKQVELNAMQKPMSLPITIPTKTNPNVDK